MYVATEQKLHRFSK